MIGFLAAAAALLVVALAAVPPLLRRAPARRGTTALDAAVAAYRGRLARLEEDLAVGQIDAEAGAEARAELERELTETIGAAGSAAPAPAERSPIPAVIVAALLPVAAIGLYLHLGSPEAVRAPSAPAAPADATAPHSIEEMVTRIEARLAAQPADPEGWLMLGRTYAALGRLPEARDALAKSDRLRPDHPATLLALAEIVATLQGDTLAGEPARLIRRAVGIAPDSPRALWLAGVEAFDRGDREAALGHWQRLDALGVLEPEAARSVRAAIASVAGQDRGASGAAPAAAPGAPGGRTLTVRVALAPGLRAEAGPADTLFVFARAAEGPRMPLAVARRTVADLPLEITLDDSMAMTPQMRLSAFDRVVVGARISKGGSATPASGDLEGASTPVAPGSPDPVSVVIERVVP